MELDAIVLHKEEGSTTADCIHLPMHATHDDDRWDDGGYPGSVDDTVYVGTGWGVRLVQLDTPPAELDIGGEAWLELTVSSASAGDFAALPEMVHSRGSSTQFLGPTNTEPVSVTAPSDATNVVEELVLVNTTDDMMQWIIALTDDQIYHHISGYGGGSGRITLMIKINGGGTN